jgi:rare lipoprotein A
MILLAGATARADSTGGAAVPSAPAAEGQALSGGSGDAGETLSIGELEARAARVPAQVATWYGPGFFGRRTACGGIMRRSTQGVAHRHLPCGTRVTIYYRGLLKTVEVIDRGPYAHRASWDLTQATARDLGIQRTSRVRVLR